MTRTIRSEQEQVRLQKLEKLREKGYPFPNDVGQLTPSSALKSKPDATADSPEISTLAGRLVQIRHMGKASFVHVLDGHGKLQVYVRKDDVGEAAFEAFKDFDIGDIVEVKGFMFTTKTGEKSLHAKAIRLLTKSLIPLPEKWHGLTDVEARYRMRYVDMISNPEVRDVFRTRARVIKEIRNFLDQHDYLEVETPVLHYIAGGANARPFATKHNALGCDMFLRIALELPLKKLVVGGLDRVYELSRVFRNEGISKKHNPEFTMLEFYQAYATYEDLMRLTEELFLHLVKTVTGGSTTLTYGEHTLDFKTPWKRVSMVDSLHDIGGVSREFDLNTLDGVQKAAVKHRISLPEKEDWGRSLEELWGELTEPKMIQPTFLIQHPFSISPLARQNQQNLKVTDRFELIIAGMEMANAFSELNDPIDQNERFEAQAARKAAGDEEATEVDHDFVRALEYGLPPTAGEGIGIDRLVMLLTNSASIRDVILFPQLKPEIFGETTAEQSVDEAQGKDQ